MTGVADIVFAPHLPWPVLGAAAVVAALVLALAVTRRATGTAGWTVGLSILWLALANPLIMIEEREARADVAVVVVDRSLSQEVGDRRRQTDDALAHIREQLAGLADVMLVVEDGPPASASSFDDDGTRLFEAARRALSDVPADRLAALIFVTDGQVHDVPEPDDWSKFTGPIHVLLTGDADERDRSISILEAPSYALIDRPLAMTVLIDDQGAVGGGTARVTLRRDGEDLRSLVLPVGRPVPIDLELNRAGPAVFEIAVEPGTDELTLANNRAAVAMNGVRERLRVLLVSGEPHAGERAWRNLLKADPGVDLVHFTILRPPEKQDGTPVRELSLISFPVRELFEVKLDEFDLVIFDRYRRRGVMPQRYVGNIVEYVQGGGALLAAIGPSFAGPLSLYNTPLGDLLPVAPSGQISNDPFRPALSSAGRRHPVTAALLPGGSAEEPTWGHWFRYVDVVGDGGDTLMTAPGDRPLLVLDRVGDGRLALLASDHIWLWARGYDGGGPQAELVRRLAHWLMKEPELEENRLTALVADGRLEIERRALETVDRPVTVTLPDGAEIEVDLADEADGIARGAIDVTRPGVYRIGDGVLSTVAAAGDLAATEFLDVRATEDRLGPLVAASGGGQHWIGADGLPDMRRVQADQTLTGRNAVTGRPWIGLAMNDDYVVIGVDQAPLTPALLILLLAAGGLIYAWRREGA